LADVYGIERRLAFWASFGGHNEKIRQLIAGNHSTRIGELQRLARGPGAGFSHRRSISLRRFHLICKEKGYIKEIEES
jgi:hypothetical protein